MAISPAPIVIYTAGLVCGSRPTSMLRRFLAALLLPLGLASVAQAQGLGVQHVKASLAAETQGAAPGSTVYVALIEKIQPHWHTYWRNPGDAGQAPTIAWTLPAGWRAGDIVWPTP